MNANIVNVILKTVTKEHIFTKSVVGPCKRSTHQIPILALPL